ncbi:TRAP transporter, DctM subunit [Ectopseudomonas chengduensis]|jgi:tripartite ATP-independent transporter DctM subunit|uniref:TRAP transporter large permease protein n=1 Tax=Ectopseudomonas chengduensis TaxID=489632 RepID=A0A1G6IV68_9GAMM|nr:TRAP transporter large permease subunit [Pseudomonas chengduensis]KJU75677.1 L-dehydroascorbate transporter large permease subunit [Pseudomonas oleovorans]KQO33454.1 L-dehydroascorbate transporter large permease subunit [Pseudomonas sp. Leaf83]ERH52653.1 dehydroascorbate transporter [Pseudomonas chengduensis]KJU75681.1 L-dehydroascorbate transporter large permease subunit [Pseudomonas oleovorans]MBP3059984.1 TRAP transporter large permease subunit [Pseudomonas chengduensis]
MIIIAIFVFSLLGAMAIGVPISYALILCALAMMYHLDLFDAQIVAQGLVNGADSFPLMAVPFFMLAGELMNAGGLSKRIVNMAVALVGHIKGGLGYVTILAACVLASLSGSAAADAAALAALLVPMMVKVGHDRATSAGLVAASGIIAPVLPPSIGLILFGVAANVSITKLFLAGIAPGLMMGLSLCVAWYLVSNRETLITRPRAPLKEILKAFYEGVWALLLPVIILVGLRAGIFTPTEAGVVAAVYALFVSLVIYRELTWKSMYQVLLSSVLTTSMVMFLVASAMVAAWMITVADLPSSVVEVLEPLMDSPRLLMLLIVAIIVVIGMAMDMSPIILILAPVMMPVAVEAGIDPVYFGVIFVMTCAIGLITPPVGLVLNVVAGVSKIDFLATARGVLPFLLAELLVIGLLLAFPQLLLVPAQWLF